MEELKQGTRIKYTTETQNGTGIIVGVATTEIPLIGRIYMVEPDKPVVSEIYKYSHIPVCESKLEVLNEIKLEKSFLSFDYKLNEKDMDTEDGKQYKCFHIDLDEDSDNGMFIKLCSWDDTLEHKDFDKFIGKKVKITIEEID